MLSPGVKNSNACQMWADQSVSIDPHVEKERYFCMVMGQNSSQNNSCTHQTYIKVSNIFVSVVCQQKPSHGSIVPDGCLV